MTFMKRLCRAGLMGFLLLVIPLVTQAAPGKFIKQVFSGNESHRMTKTETLAYQLFQRGDMIQTRSLSEKILRRNKRSYVAHFFMSYILYYNEGQLLKSLWHLRQAQKYHSEVSSKRKAYARMVFMDQEIRLLRQLGFHRRTLKLLKTYESLFPNDSLDPLKPWSYMKLGQYKKAIALAKKLLPKKKHRVSALNALCATYYEMGSRRQHLKYCLEALQLDSKKKTKAGTDLATHNFNVSEAYMSLINFAKAEKYALAGTKHFHPYTYSNPWRLLVGLYLEEGRINDAWNALKESQRWFQKQKPVLAESVYAGVQVTQAMFFLSLSKPEMALKILERIRDRPDRRGHSSSRMEQQLVTIRLVRRHGLLLRSQEIRERMPAKSFWQRMKLRVSLSQWRMESWRQGALIRKLLLKKAFLQKVFSPFRSGSISLPNSSMPFWMSLDLVPLLGPAIVRQQIRRLRTAEKGRKSVILPFLDAIESYACALQGQRKQALILGQRALKGLPPRFKPLRLAIALWSGQVYQQLGKTKRMLQQYRKVIRKDGSFFRRFRVALPVVVKVQNDTLQKALARNLLASPRFQADPKGLILQLRRLGSSLIVQLNGRDGTVLSILRLKAHKKEKRGAFLLRAQKEIHLEFFSPKISLIRKNLFSLDSSLSSHSQRRTSWENLLKQLKPRR